jgi:hypothetical protein
MVLSFTTTSLRNKLGNTIAANYAEESLTKAVSYGVSNACSFSHTVPEYWLDSNPYWGTALGAAMQFAVAWVRTTQVNVSIQMTREYQNAVSDCEQLYKTLLSEGLLRVGTSQFVTEEFTTEVLNPFGGTHVTGLHGIVRRNRLLDMQDWLYTPY